MSHSSKIKDADAFFEVDAITRQIINKTPHKITLVQGDHDSERFTFALPRNIEGHDMAESAKAEVHFINIETGGANSHADKYEMKDLQPDPNDESKVICTWLISNNATQYAGRLAFMIRFACLDDNDNYVYVWNTATNEEISITNGMDNGAAMVDNYPDILAQWKADVLSETASFKKLPEGTNIDDVKVEGCYVLYNDHMSYAECITLHVVKAHVSDNENQMDIPCIKQIRYIHSGQDSNEVKIQYRHDAFGKWSAWEDALSGGSGGETWELISSGELTEEVSLLSLDGFSCSKVEFKISVAYSGNNSQESAMSVRTNINANRGGGNNNSLTKMFRTTETRQNAVILLEMHNKTIQGTLHNSTSHGDYVNYYVNEPSVSEYDSITGIYLFPTTSGIVFGVGTTYELWGVRK